MGYCPDNYWETKNYDYYSNNREKFEELKETMRKHMSETQQLDYLKSQFLMRIQQLRILKNPRKNKIVCPS